MTKRICSATMTPTTREAIRVSAMNNYGALAQKHWETQRPSDYGQISDRETFFTQLGAQIAAEIERRRNQDERETGAGQTTNFLANLNALTLSQTTIEAAVMREMVYDLPEGSPS